LLENLQENNTLATETTGEENQNLSWNKAGPRLGGSDGLADLRNSMLVLMLLVRSFLPMYLCSPTMSNRLHVQRAIAIADSRISSIRHNSPQIDNFSFVFAALQKDL
jgi:hypothetical protein